MAGCTFNNEGLYNSLSGMMVLNAELKTTNFAYIPSIFQSVSKCGEGLASGCGVKAFVVYHQCYKER